MKCSSDELETAERLCAHAVVQALHMSGVTVKEAAGLMRLDYSQFSRQLRAEPGQHLSLTRLMRLCGTGFWLWFGPSLLLIVARDRYVEMADTLLFFGRRRYGQGADPVRGEVGEQRRA